MVINVIHVTFYNRSKSLRQIHEIYFFMLKCFLDTFYAPLTL